VRVLRKVKEDPGTSARRIAAAESIGFSLVWRILRKQPFYPYYSQQVQALAPPRHLAVMVFCQWFLAKYVVNPQFVGNILLTDEAGFSADGIANFHYTHVWEDDSLHTTVASRHQHRFSINVWVGILCDQILGPVVLPNRLASALYYRFLVNDSPVLLEHVPLHQRQHMWFMHDAVSSYVLCIVST
jgi:hypothetical protein